MSDGQNYNNMDTSEYYQRCIVINEEHGFLSRDLSVVTVCNALMTAINLRNKYLFVGEQDQKLRDLMAEAQKEASSVDGQSAGGGLGASGG